MAEEKSLASRVAAKAAQTLPDGPQKAKAEVQTINSLIERMAPEFAKALGGAMDHQRFCRVLITTIRTNANLQTIAVHNPSEVLSACMEVAQLGLDPTVPNEVFLVPYAGKNSSGQRDMTKGTIEVQIGYKGLAKLADESARDSGQALTVLRQETIHQNDTYKRSGGANPSVELIPAPFGKDRGPVLGFVATSKDAYGRINYHEMTVDEVRDHKTRFSKARTGPFADEANFNAYGLKTVLRLLVMRHLPMGPKLARAVGRDIEQETGAKPGWLLEAAEDAKAEIPALPDVDVTPSEVPAEGISGLSDDEKRQIEAEESANG